VTLRRLALAAALAAAGAFAAELSYTFTVVPGSPVTLRVELEFAVSPDRPAQLVLPNEYGGESGMWRWIEQLAVVAGPVELQPGEQPFLRRIRASARGQCRVRYVLRVPEQPLAFTCWATRSSHGRTCPTVSG
jgi:hypothetical protein